MGITLLDRQGRITFANSFAQKHLGVTRSEMAVRSYNPPDWRITDYSGNPFPEEELPFRKVMATGQAVFGVRHAVRSPGGARILLSVNAAEYDRHHCRKLVQQRGGKWTLTSQGLNLLGLLTYN